MIAIDTNILLRYLLKDDEVQWQQAHAIINGTETILITDIVLAETIWTLTGKRFNLNRQAVIDTVHKLFNEPQLVFEDGQAVWSALKDFANAKPIGKKKHADLQDALIVNKAKRYGNRHGIVVAPVYTFDKAALEIDGTQHP